MGERKRKKERREGGEGNARGSVALESEYESVKYSSQAIMFGE